MWDLFVFACLMLLVVATAFIEQSSNDRSAQHPSIYSSTDLSTHNLPQNGHQIH